MISSKLFNTESLFEGPQKTLTKLDSSESSNLIKRALGKISDCGEASALLRNDRQLDIFNNQASTTTLSTVMPAGTEVLDLFWLPSPLKTLVLVGERGQLWTLEVPY